MTIACRNTFMLRHVKHMNWVISHMWISHVTQITHVRGAMIACRNTFKLSHITHIDWVISHVWIRHSHVWMSYVTHMSYIRSLAVACRKRERERERERVISGRLYISQIVSTKCHLLYHLNGVTAAVACRKISKSSHSTRDFKLSHFTLMNWVKSHVCMSHVTHIWHSLCNWNDWVCNIWMIESVIYIA